MPKRRKSQPLDPSRLFTFESASSRRLQRFNQQAVARDYAIERPPAVKCDKCKQCWPIRRDTPLYKDVVQHKAVDVFYLYPVAPEACPTCRPIIDMENWEL